MASSSAQRWLQDRTFHHSRFDARWLAEQRGRSGQSISVCLPARETAATVGPAVAALVALRDAGAIDEVVVIDAASNDGTARVAADAGARVLQEAELMPAFGPVLGKGDAMWRALSALEGELVCFLDADSTDLGAHFAVGLLGPLVADPAVAFVKACYRRPFNAAGLSLPDGGGRVSQLAARPALALFYPELAGIRQPLAGEVAARRELLEGIPFATGYGVEIAMLIDVWEQVGLAGIAQVDLDVRHNAHQPLAALTPMAFAVLATIATRLARDGRLDRFEPEGLLGDAGEPLARPLVERPALSSLRAAH